MLRTTAPDVLRRTRKVLGKGEEGRKGGREGGRREGGMGEG